MTTINEVDSSSSSTQPDDPLAYAIQALQDDIDEAKQIPPAAWNDPTFARRRTMTMAAELEVARLELLKAQRFIRHMAAMLHTYQEELGRPLAPPPEVQQAMTVRTGHMHPIAMTAGTRELVVVAPPDGFDNPAESWRNIVGHYSTGG